MFLDEYNNSIPTLGEARLQEILSSLSAQYGVTASVQAELAATAHAMVVRSALAMSAADARVAVLAAPGLAGEIVLASGRQLLGAGVSALEVFLTSPASEFESDQLRALQALGITARSLPELMEFPLEQVHCLLLGVSKFSAPPHSELAHAELDGDLCEKLNECSVPIHCIVRPPHDAQGRAVLLCASTLSVGLPLDSLLQFPDHAGRTYLADVTLQPIILKDFDIDLPYVFTEQPVIRLLSPHP